MMDAQTARDLEQWFAGQFKAMPGGFEGACSLPDYPITARKLGEASRALARVSLADALYLCAAKGRADLLRMLADQIDGGESATQALARLARAALYSTAHLAERVERAEEDGVYTAAEVHELQQDSAKNLQSAVAVNEATQKLNPGPVTRQRAVAE